MVELVDGSVVEKFEALGDGGGRWRRVPSWCGSWQCRWLAVLNFSFAVGPGVPEVEVVFGLDGAHGVASGSGVFIVNFEDSAEVRLFYLHEWRGANEVAHRTWWWGG